MQAFLRVDGENYLNPELFFFALCNASEILTEDKNLTRYSILRVENFLEDGTTPFR